MNRTIMPIGVIAVILLAGCAAPPSPGPVGLAAEDFPPRVTSPEGVLGDAEVGADDLSDPAIDTLGDPIF